ncbi:hypothetical protein ACFL1X_06590 [Candidatus Hydrogenedentota bacterium]
MGAVKFDMGISDIMTALKETALSESGIRQIEPTTFYASQWGAKLDSDVIAGGGSDDTQALQVVLDKAPALGRLHLVVDGPALVRGLDVHSNTTIECPNPACGFFLADDSNRPILRNVHPSREEIIDRNIVLSGGIYNQNCRNQVHHTEDSIWVVGLGFFGVENLFVSGLRVRNFRTFAFHLANWRWVTFHDVSLELSERMQGENQDGIHFHGPGQFLTMRNIRGCAWDDFIALNADGLNAEPDGKGGLKETNCFGPYVGFGPITDVLIEGVMLDDSAQVVRMLSRGSLVDRVVIRDVVGSYRSFGFWLTPCLERGGNFGNIVVDTVDLRHSEPNYTARPPFLFLLGGNFEHLALRNIMHSSPADNRSIILMEPGADFRALIIDGLNIAETSEESAGGVPISLDGWIDRLSLRNLHLSRAKDLRPRPFLLATAYGSHRHGVGKLFVSGASFEGLESLLFHGGGEIGAVHMDNVVFSDTCESAMRLSGGALGDVNANGVRGPRELVEEDPLKLKYPV